MRWRRVMLFMGAAGCIAACGSRTGLLVPVVHDAAVDDSGADVGPDVAEEPDVVEEPDATFDVEADAPEEDQFVFPDGPSICPDAGSTFIYVISSGNLLKAFYPPTASFYDVGTINCPTTVAGDTPFSMAVDRSGVAYVVFNSGNLFKVSTLTAACVATSYDPFINSVNFPRFGMGFSANDPDGGDAGETLYVAGDPGAVAGSVGPTILGTIDVKTFHLTPIGSVHPSIYQSELTGTGGGQLYGFYTQTSQTGLASIGQIDKTTSALLSSVFLPSIDIQTGWAFAFWGGDFYTFTAPTGTDTTVQRYRPSDGSVVTVATGSGFVVVGAGVSTCAPQM